MTSLSQACAEIQRLAESWITIAISDRLHSTPTSQGALYTAKAAFTRALAALEAELAQEKAAGEQADALLLDFRTINATLDAENKRMATVLEWLDRRGGLGYDAHDRITAALADYRTRPTQAAHEP